MGSRGDARQGMVSEKGDTMEDRYFISIYEVGDHCSLEESQSYRQAGCFLTGLLDDVHTDAIAPRLQQSAGYRATVPVARRPFQPFTALRTRRGRHEALTAVALLSPAAVILALVIFYSIYRALQISFRDATLLNVSVSNSIGRSNFQQRCATRWSGSRVRFLCGMIE